MKKNIIIALVIVSLTISIFFLGLFFKNKNKIYIDSSNAVDNGITSQKGIAIPEKIKSEQNLKNNLK